jgi:hypothetical protein
VGALVVTRQGASVPIEAFHTRDEAEGRRWGLTRLLDLEVS